MESSWIEQSHGRDRGRSKLATASRDYRRVTQQWRFEFHFHPPVDRQRGEREREGLVNIVCPARAPVNFPEFREIRWASRGGEGEKRSIIIP